MGYLILNRQVFPQWSYQSGCFEMPPLGLPSGLISKLHEIINVNIRFKNYRLGPFVALSVMIGWSCCCVRCSSLRPCYDSTLPVWCEKKNYVQKYIKIIMSSLWALLRAFNMITYIHYAAKVGMNPLSWCFTIIEHTPFSKQNSIFT